MVTLALTMLRATGSWLFYVNLNHIFVIKSIAGRIIVTHKRFEIREVSKLSKDLTFPAASTLLVFGLKTSPTFN